MNPNQLTVESSALIQSATIRRSHVCDVAPSGAFINNSAGS